MTDDRASVPAIGEPHIQIAGGRHARITTGADIPGDATPPLAVRAWGFDRSLPAGPTYWIGRDPAADVVVDELRVSWRHAFLKVTNGRWVLEDVGSTNGTWDAGRRVRSVEITGSCQVRLGHPDAGPVLSCSIADSKDEGAALVHSATAIIPMPATVIRIGRSQDNDVVVADQRVSRHHAELHRSPGGKYEITDLDSPNGTFLNGRRITRAAVGEAGDVIGIGPASFRLDAGQIYEFVDVGDTSLEARGLTVTLPNGKVLLDAITFPLSERCLLGVIGPSGAGKSTLLGALTGMRPATTGSVIYDGRDLYADYAELRHRIGLVPQENILHTQLSAHRALGYAAELRFPRGTSANERGRRIGEVLGELSLTPHAGTRASALSGGQQKRVNVALELLTKPSLLFLDEPTSGLDPGLDASVMEMISGLARDGRIVIVVTHSVANLNVCDRLLVLVAGGKLAYFGSPADGLRYFGRPSWAQVFQAFESEPNRDWAGDYQRSPYFSRYVAEPARAHHQPAVAGRPAPPSPKPQNRLAQLFTLIRRYLAVIASDRNYVGALVLLPVILGALVRAMPDPGGLTGPSNGFAIQVLLILMLGACMIGVANAVRELVKERPIYHRERAAGLSPGSYLASKLGVLGLISVVQAVLLVLIGLAGRPLPAHGAVLTAAPLAELMIATSVLAVASMTIGLLISATVNSSDKTMPLLVVAVLAEVVLSGAVFRLNGMAGLGQLSWLSPSRWGFAAVSSTTDLNHVTPPPPGNTPDQLWLHSPRIWAFDMAMLSAITVVLAGLTWWRLCQNGPGRRR